MRARFDPRRWLLLLLAPGMTVALLLDPETAPLALGAGAITLVVMVVGIVGLARLDGRSRLAEVRLDGERLLVRGHRAFGAGPVRAIPLAEVTGWEAYRLAATMQHEEGLRFRWRGRPYRLPLSQAQEADIDALARLRLGLGSDAA